MGFEPSPLREIKLTPIDVTDQTSIFEQLFLFVIFCLSYDKAIDNDS